METIQEEMKSAHDTFTERMVRRNSSMTLLRRRKIIQAIEEESSDSPPMIIDPKARYSFISSSFNGLKIKEKEEMSETRHEINSETRVIDDETKSPQAKRRCYRPNMESTRILSMTYTTEVMDSEVVTIPVGVKHRSDRIPDEVERFLVAALDNELNNTEVTLGVDADAQEKDNSQFIANESIPKKIQPFFKRMTRLWKHRRSDYVVNDAEIPKGVTDSGTLDRSVRLYKTLSQRIKKKIRAALIREKSPDSASPSDPLHSLSSDKHRMDMMENILKQMQIQQCTIEQASKALNVCCTSKEFIGSSEQVESERLLLLAVIRKRLLLAELKRFTNTSEDILEIKESSDIAEWAEVTIENINLSLRECLKRESLAGESMQWFIVVIIEGTNVWGSLPVMGPVGSMHLEFSNFKTTIDNLKANFKILIEIHSLNLKPGTPYNEDDKSHLNTTLNRTWTYLSPAKLLKRMEKSPRVQRHDGIRSSSFTKCGQLELSLHDLTLPSPWTLTAVPHDSILRGIIDLNLSSKLHLSICHEGFLNYGEAVGGCLTWNTRWCVLKGNMMMFWNYPRDQESKPPIKTIELRQCFSEGISEVERELCAKPRTIVVETVRVREAGDVDSALVKCTQTHTVQRHLLSFDNKKDVIEWKSKLNNIIFALRDWNVKFMKSTPKSSMIPVL